MKILHIYKCFNDPPKGGVEQFIKQFSLVLKKNVKKNDIFVLGKINKSYSYANLYSENELLNIASCGIGGVSFFIKFYKLMKSYDIFIFHYPWPFGDLLSFLLILSKKNYFIYYHSDIVRQRFLKILYKPLEIFFLKNAKIIFTSSNNYLKSSLNLKKYSKKIKILPLFFSQDLNKKIKKRNLKSFSLQKKKYFVFVGSYRYYKGLEFLDKCVESFPDYKFIYIGSGIKKKILLKKNTLIFENVSDSKKYFLIKNSLGLILPSIARSEAFGYSLLEALNLSVPMISTNLGTGTSFVNKNNHTGLVIKPKSIYELKKAINFFIHNKQMLKNFVKNSKKHYYKEFNFKKIVKIFIDSV